MKAEEILSKFEGEQIRSPDVTKRSRVKQARDFLDFVEQNGLELDREAVERYWNKLERERYSVGTIRNKLQIVKRLYDIAKVDWPLGKRWMPQIRSFEKVTPVLEPGEIEQLIKTAKEGKLDRVEVAYLALSTTYGLRRVELSRISPHDIDLRKKQLKVYVAKGGDLRVHLVPNEIKRFLSKDGFGRYSAWKLSQMWWHIMERSGLGYRPEYGWHSIRRALDTQLLSEGKVPYFDVKQFLRWKLSGEMPMVYYHKPDEQVDREVFENHPFIKFWC